ncbi:TPM domain-containing protein [Flavobacterium cerinum]|uniref:TPM domain-containing protein n=1 Tax=Flavobacterium cerinum TaxID=2502784 RepID=A0ABY5IVZ8_9FLAO|nr:TPM domain-containing protein [Flavobacterium cerinum]UUC45692.1 TPM domain-containing protein [Flavobacterium cerinum]
MTYHISKIIKNLLLPVFFLLLQPVSAQFTIPEKPKFQTSVYDYANMLRPQEKQSLEEKLIHYSDSTTTQIVVVTIESLQGEDIGILTPKWAHQWGIGQAKEDNGVFILLAKNERRIWISPGYGVEDRLTAGIVGEITRNIIIPEFKAGSYYTGLDKGVDAIVDVLKGKYKGSRKGDQSDDGVAGIFIFIFIVIILIIVLARGRKPGGGKGGIGGGSGPGILDMIILSSLGRGGGGGFGGGSSGGGFGGGGFGGGFGGGGFSGGGAGGSW